MLLGRRLASGIRALYELSKLPERRSAVRELARICGVSEPFLRRIFLDLRAKGYLEAQKGRVGGFKLVREPSEIKILDLAKILEKSPELVLGRTRRDLISVNPDCPTYPFWENVEKKMMEEMASLTLADVIALAAPAVPEKPKRATRRRTAKKKGKAKTGARSRRRSRR